MEEIQLLKRLKHPNIVEYYGSQLESRSFLVFMEWVSGEKIKGYTSAGVCVCVCLFVCMCEFFVFMS